MLEDIEDRDLEELLDVVKMLLHVLLCSSSSTSASKLHSSILNRRQVSWKRRNIQTGQISNLKCDVSNKINYKILNIQPNPPKNFKMKA